MTIRTTSVFRDPPVLVNNIGTENLYSCTFFPEDVGALLGIKGCPAGTCVAAKPGGGHRLLGRSKIISPYTSGGATVAVSNPTVFKTGDVLYRLSAPGTTPQAELAAIREGTAPEFGTVVSVDQLTRQQITTATPNSVAVGNIFTLTIEGVAISFTATATSNANVIAGLKAAFDAQRSSNSALGNIRMTAGASALEVTTAEEGQIFTCIPSVAQGSGGTLGTLAVAVTAAIGLLEITPAGGNGNQVIGAKIGTLGDVVLGILAHSLCLTDGLQASRLVSESPYSAGQIYSKALPYLDADIAAQLPKLSFLPPYIG